MLFFDFFVNKILGNYLKDEQQLSNLLEMVYRRYLWHLVSTRNLQKIYNRRANFLSAVIPIYSAVLTFFLTTNLFDLFLDRNKQIFSSVFLSIMGFGLTIMTILDANSKHYDKSLELSNILIALNSWLTGFNVKIFEIMHQEKKLQDLTETMIHFIQ